MTRLRIFLVLTVSLLLLLCQSVSVAKKSGKRNKPHHLAYFYDIKTNRTLKPPFVSFTNEDEEYAVRKVTAATTPAPVRPQFGRRCDCKPSANRMSNVCSCCAGLKLPRIRFQREMCTRFQYNLSQRNQMLMDVTMDGNPVASQTFNCEF